MTPSLSIIVPVRNEAGTIKRIIDECPDFGTPTEVLFIESSSTDDTVAVLTSVCASYQGPLKLQYESLPLPGKGPAVERGFQRASGTICILYDADMSVPPEELRLFYDALKDTPKALANGTRFRYTMEKRAMQPLNYLANRGFAFLLGRLTRWRLSDTLCGTKALWRDAYLNLPPLGQHCKGRDPFGDFDLLLRARAGGLQLVEVPVHYRARVYGVTNIRRWAHGWVLLKMILCAWYFNRKT